ncbi:MAG: adenine phosphoribosyltransferase [Verrucomicrobiota bacterium]
MTDISTLIKSNIRTARNWPKPGVNFRDPSGVFSDVGTFQALVSWFGEIVYREKITRIAGIDARGFLIAGALAHATKLPLALVRKKGKLPPKTIEASYSLEYGTASIEVQMGIVEKDDHLLLIDDLIATGGTVRAAIELFNRLGLQNITVGTIIDLPELGGSRLLEEAGVPVNCACSYTEDE